MIMSISRPSRNFRASVPSSAISTSKPSFSRVKLTTSRMLSESSTISIFLGMVLRCVLVRSGPAIYPLGEARGADELGEVWF